MYPYHRSIGAAAHRAPGCDFGSLLGFVLSKPGLEFGRRLELGFLDTRTAGVVASATAMVACNSTTLRLSCKELLANTCIVCGQDVFGDALHAEDLDVWSGAVRKRILYRGQSLLMHLIEMDRQAFGANQ